MKKTIIFIVMAAYAAGCLQAQDTLWMKPAPLNNYFNNNWIDTTGIYSGVQMHFGASRAIARQFVTNDTMRVFGIAAMMVPSYFGYHMTPAQILAEFNILWPEDPTYNNMEDTLILFQYNGSGSPQLMQQIGDSLPVNYLQTPVSHYIMSNRQPISNLDTIAKPVYERYFSTPQTVHDTFFAGYTTSQWEYDWKDSIYYEKRPPFYCMGFDHAMGRFFWDYEEEVAAFILREDPTQPYWIFHRQYVNNAYYIFPILTPPGSTHELDTTTVGGGVVVQGDSVIVCDTLIVGGDTIVSYDTLSIHDFVVGTDSVLVGDSLLVVTDTIVIGGDTIVVSDTLLSVMHADMLQRLTGVMPSPARDRAKVVSGVGLTGVEVYSLTGRRVHTLRLPGSPLSATLDVSRWPSGTYLLRITTPMGTTMKKLTVTR